ncbi:hypothetical protein CSPX01_00686 [Colletotrichum filicis]|nr:hypothetical protein CSPX01_00686 [Colletotrichum filicis]
MHFQSTTLFLAAAVIFQGVFAQFCTGPPSDCNFEDCRINYADPWAICKSKVRFHCRRALRFGFIADLYLVHTSFRPRCRCFLLLRIVVLSSMNE